MQNSSPAPIYKRFLQYPTWESHSWSFYCDQNNPFRHLQQNSFFEVNTLARAKPFYKTIVLYIKQIYINNFIWTLLNSFYIIIEVIKSEIQDIRAIRIKLLLLYCNVDCFTCNQDGQCNRTIIRNFKIPFNKQNEEGQRKRNPINSKLYFSPKEKNTKMKTYCETNIHSKRSFVSDIS